MISSPVPDVPGRGLALVLVVSTIAFVAALMRGHERAPDIALTASDLFVSHGNIAMTIPRSEMSDVQLLTTIGGIGWKRTGYSGGTSYRGRLALRGDGDAMLFLDTRTPPFIRVRSPRGVLVFSAETPAVTRALYDSLVESRRGTRATAAHHP